MPLAAPLAALLWAHVFDWASFMAMVARHGLGAEVNPIVVTLAQEAGVPGLTLAKMATVAFAALAAVLIAPRRRRMALALLTFGVAAGMVGGFSNIAAL
jgi:hypothetical protein